MPRRRSRDEWVKIGFMTVWLVFWTSAIFVAIWTLGRTAWHGEAAALMFIAVWLVVAAFGLRSGARGLIGLLLAGKSTPPPFRDHRWDDGIDPPPR